MADTANTAGDGLDLNGKLSGSTKPFSRFEWMLARRYLGSTRKETFISVISVISFIGIMLGVMTLIIVLAVMNGFRTELLDRILGINGHLIVAPAQSDLTDYAAVARRIEGVDAVTMALPLIEGEVLATGGRGGTGARVRGMREADLKRMEAVGGNIVEGTLDGFDADALADTAPAPEEEIVVEEDGTIAIREPDITPQAQAPRGTGVAIGVKMAEALALGVGDYIRLISPAGDVTAFGALARDKSYRVAAIFEMGMSEYDNLFVFMPLKAAQLYFNRADDASVIEVFVEDPDDVGDVIDPVEAAAERPVVTTDWRQRNKTFFDALQVERNVMFLILTLILLVAALNIVSGLFMLVKDKGSDIAILRTMGATRGSVMRIFLIAGSSIGVIGTLAGFMLGVVIVLNIKTITDGLAALSGANVWDPTVRFLSEIPAELNIVETVVVVLMALGLSLLATWFPAWRAARLDPVEALRYE